ncbi:MAG: hypothetical protein C0596_15950 [Marinilabiliales bacterium]|nr:MAG: hypothetical protein C0596_15950 [Marinilabiliales bacterium]
MKKILLFVGIVTISTLIFAQQSGPAISWDKTVHDFGKFNEADGKVVATFEFVNTGNEPLYITNVKASCGCTSPEWSKEPVKPGEKGYVKAAYDPNKRPGKFNKSITVTTNEFQPTSILRIMGEVIPKEQ